MSKFNELYGYLSDRQTPHLFVIAEVLYGVKEALEKQNEHLASMNTKLDALVDATKANGSNDSADA